jgi:hypothetical protein
MTYVKSCNSIASGIQTYPTQRCLAASTWPTQPWPPAASSQATLPDAAVSVEATQPAESEVVHLAHTYCVEALLLSIGRRATVQVYWWNFRFYPLHTSETLRPQPCYGCPVCVRCGNLLIDDELSPHNLLEKVDCCETVMFVDLCIAQWACRGRLVGYLLPSVPNHEWLHLVHPFWERNALQKRVCA